MHEAELFHSRRVKKIYISMAKLENMEANDEIPLKMMSSFPAFFLSPKKKRIYRIPYFAYSFIVPAPKVIKKRIFSTSGEVEKTK